VSVLTPHTSFEQSLPFALHQEMASFLGNCLHLLKSRRSPRDSSRPKSDYDDDFQGTEESRNEATLTPCPRVLVRKGSEQDNTTGRSDAQDEGESILGLGIRKHDSVMDEDNPFRDDNMDGERYLKSATEEETEGQWEEEEEAGQLETKRVRDKGKGGRMSRLKVKKKGSMSL